MIEIPDTFRGGEDAEIETQVSRRQLWGTSTPSSPTKVMQDISCTLHEQAMSCRTSCRNKQCPVKCPVGSFWSCLPMEDPVGHPIGCPIGFGNPVGFTQNPTGLFD